MHALSRDLERQRKTSDEQKAAALDAAIEFEDALVPNRQSSLINLQSPKGISMIDQQLMTDLAELDEVAGRFKDDEAKLREICRRIGAGGSTTLQEGVTVPQAVQTEESPVEQRCRGRGRPSDSIKVRWRSSLQVRCTSCGVVVEGCKQRGECFYPYKHRTRNRVRCPGCDLPGLLIDDPKTEPNPGSS